MTIQKRLEELCVEHGLWPDEATKVVAAHEAASDADMKSRWHHDTTEYPAPMLAVLWTTTKHHALAYIDAEKPMHFARPMFDSAVVDGGGPENVESGVLLGGRNFQ